VLSLFVSLKEFTPDYVITEYIKPNRELSVDWHNTDWSHASIVRLIAGESLPDNKMQLASLPLLTV
jgi:hypothetical protein